MEMIAWQLAERVSRNVNIKTIYRASPQKVKELSADAKKCLECWKASYLDVRAKIEENERDARWEFDKIKLFGVTDYMANICKDIYDVAQVLEEFYNIFGPELKVSWLTNFIISFGFCKLIKVLIEDFPTLYFRPNIWLWSFINFEFLRIVYG